MPLGPGARWPAGHSGAGSKCLPIPTGPESVFDAMASKTRWAAGLSLGASALGLLFASYSTFDYANHLDRGLHDVHCSFIPGAPATDAADACRAAMYSPYSALLKQDYWGGIPISLFAVGAFAFFLAFAVYLLGRGGEAPRSAADFFGVVGVTPLLVSLGMLFISATRVGAFCKTCIGIYIASALLALGAGLAAWFHRREATVPARGDPRATPATNLGIVYPFAWLAVLGAFTFLPAVVYAAAMPDHRPYLASCGELKKPASDALLRWSGSRAVKAVTLFEDPLCPTCKAFHDRLVAEGFYEKLDVRLALFPLDNACNWMLDQPLHPGACMVARAVLCAGPQARQALEWAYEKQEYLTRAGKAGEGTLRAVIQERWGAPLTACVDSPKAKTALNAHLHYAAENGVPVSTPQMYLDHQRRFCDEDTDIGLVYTLAQLAPEVTR
jgi:uncharacterized membrane protein